MFLNADATLTDVNDLLRTSKISSAILLSTPKPTAKCWSAQRQVVDALLQVAATHSYAMFVVLDTFEDSVIWLDLWLEFQMFEASSKIYGSHKKSFQEMSAKLTKLWAEGQRKYWDDDDFTRHLFTERLKVCQIAYYLLHRYATEVVSECQTDPDGDSLRQGFCRLALDRRLGISFSSQSTKRKLPRRRAWKIFGCAASDIDLKDIRSNWSIIHAEFALQPVDGFRSIYCGSDLELVLTSCHSTQAHWYP